MTEELLYEAWTLIANAGEGDWNRETPEWRKAAERWRDRWHATLTVTGTPPFIGYPAPRATVADLPKVPSGPAPGTRRTEPTRED